MKYLNNITKVFLQNWWNIQDTGNFIYLVKDSDHEGEDHSDEAIAAYQILNDQIIEKYGVSNTFMKILKKKKRYLVLMNDGLAKGDKHIQWKAELIEKEIDHMINQETDSRREDSLVIIHKFIGGNMPNPNEMTVDQFYYNMDFVNRGLKAQRKSIKNG